MNYSPKKLSDQLSENEFSFKKKFGQNFIIDENIINSIVNKSKIDKDTLVIEIGPGSGALTAKLCKQAKHVLCYEIDETLNSILSDNLKGNENYEIIFDDFLKRNVNEDLKKHEYSKLYVVANLPYYITTPILISLVEKKVDVDKIVVMVQKEVGNRFNAKPGCKEYNSLTVYLNYYFNVKKMVDVSKNVFIPRPNVDSVVVEFNKKTDFPKINNLDLFFKLVRTSFTQKRKTLKNNLKQYDLIKVENALKKHDLDLSVRAEKLDINIFVDIANELSK